VDFKAIDIFVPPREDYLEKRWKTLKSTPDGVRFYRTEKTPEDIPE
jgi:hypothetical protein